MTGRTIGICNIAMGFAFIFLTVLYQPALAQTICCDCTLATTPIEMPEEQLQDYGSFVQGELVDCITTAMLDEPVEGG